MSSTKVWQIGAGEVGRRYDDLFLEHDVMFCGPSEFGPFAESSYQPVVASGRYSAMKIGQVRKFAQEVKPGDRVLLRTGYKVVALGIVADEKYEYNASFEDIFGWDVAHTHRVVWQRQHDSALTQLQTAGDLFASRKQIPTFTSVDDSTILEPIQSLLAQTISRPLKELPPKPSPVLTPEEFSAKLFSKGLAYDAVDRVERALRKQKKLLNWYWSSGQAGDRPTEHEVVAHLILPLMLALGWSEQLLAVEWNRVDLAAFWKTPTTHEHCKLICEAKTMGHGLQDVPAQAKKYAEDPRFTECDKILVSDGGRFYLYRRVDGQWSAEPSGYVNILMPRERYTFPRDTSAVDTMIALTPVHIAN